MMLVRIKIFPEEAGLDLSEVARGIALKLPEGLSIRGEAKEPIAFGLEALILDIEVPDEEGMIDKVEDIVKGAPKVSNVQVLSASRLSAKLRRTG